jgi:hypothetical protein
MKFIWVNGRMPASQSVCAVCRRAIGAAYLRHIETRLYYCDPDCYASVHAHDAGIRPFTSRDAGATLASALTLLNLSSEAELAY